MFKQIETNFCQIYYGNSTNFVVVVVVAGEERSLFLLFVFDMALNHLDYHSRPQGYKKVKTSRSPLSILVFYLDLLVWWTSHSFGLMYSIIKGGNPTQFCFSKTSHWLAFGQSSIKFLQTCQEDSHNWTQQFDSSLNDVDLHSRSQLNEKAKSSAFVYS